MKVRRRNFLLIIILLLFSTQSLIALKSTSLVFDETSSITIGYYFVSHLETSMFILHPPLSFILGGFPLLFLDVNLPYSYKECTDAGYYKCAQELLFRSNNDPEKIGAYARLPFVLISLLLGLVLFFFTLEMYGTEAGFFALALYAFSPAILAYNTIVFTDLIVTFFVFSTIYFLWKLVMQGYTRMRMLLTSVSLGLALASKFTAILLIPIIILIFTIKIYNGNDRKKLLKRFSIQFVTILLVGFVTLHSTYFFSFGSIADSIPERNVRFAEASIEKYFAKEGFSRKSADFFIYDLKIPMPEYWAGFAAQFYIDSSKRKDNYLNGVIYGDGKWYYFFEVLLIKTPIPLIIFFLVSSFTYLKSIRKKFMNELFVLLPIVFFLGAFIPSNFNLGLRHILPIMPFIFMSSSRILDIKFASNTHHRLFRIFTYSLLLWYILSSLFIMPHYIAYFNELIGGPKNGHKHLLSSNLDMGQDLKRLGDYLKKNNIGRIKLSYHGSFDPLHYNISYEPLPMEYYIAWVPWFSPSEPDENYTENCSKKYGIIAISVNNLHNYHLINKSCFNWLNGYQPVKSLGYTLYVYNITN